MISDYLLMADKCKEHFFISALKDRAKIYFVLMAKAKCDVYYLIPDLKVGAKTSFFVPCFSVVIIV